MDKIGIRGLLIKLTKIEALQFGDNHPNGINTGYEKTGKAISDVQVGACFYLDGDGRWDTFRSSPVTEVIDHNTFKTSNSTYSIQVL